MILLAPKTSEIIQKCTAAVKKTKSERLTCCKDEAKTVVGDGCLRPHHYSMTQLNRSKNFVDIDALSKLSTYLRWHGGDG